MVSGRAASRSMYDLGAMRLSAALFSGLPCNIEIQCLTGTDPNAKHTHKGRAIHGTTGRQSEAGAGSSQIRKAASEAFRKPNVLQTLEAVAEPEAKRVHPGSDPRRKLHGKRKWILVARYDHGESAQAAFQRSELWRLREGERSEGRRFSNSVGRGLFLGRQVQGLVRRFADSRVDCEEDRTASERSPGHSRHRQHQRVNESFQYR